MDKQRVSAFGLKVAAIAGMTCNHVANIFATQMPLWLTVGLYSFGGLTFPIMAFLLCEGYRYTSNIRRYALRLSVFALVAQVPYSLLWGATANVLVTLLIGLGLLWTGDHLRPRLARYGVVAGGLIVSLVCDWGGIGPAMILLFHHLRNSPRGVLTVMLVPLLSFGLPAVGGLATAMNADAGSESAPQASLAPSAASEHVGETESYLQTAANTPGSDSPVQNALTGDQNAMAQPNTIVAAGVFAANLGTTGYCFIGFGLAALLLACYNGRRGRPLKWFFYVYYPAHLLILWAIAQALARAFA